MENNDHRIAINTLLLYFRQILILLVSLYTVRIVLRVMGAENFGIFNVVAGIATMFGALSGAMATASQRFFSFELGRNDLDKLRDIFSMSMNIYIVISILIFFGAEASGVWFINNKLIIPASRIYAAHWVFQFSLFSFLASFLTTPYMAVIIARENMGVYAYVSILEVVLRLISIFLLQFVSCDKLILYSALLFLVAIVNSLLYVIICTKKYAESRYFFYWNTLMFRVIFSYVGWNLFGASVSVVKNQAINILLNISFGPLVNAARGIAAQVSAAVVSFSQSFSTAVRPQIIKLYANNEQSRFLRLVFSSSKMTVYLMFIFILPLYLEMPIIMHIWLQQVPMYAVQFTRLVLIDVLIDSISYPLMTAAQASGKIKLYQAIVGGILLFNLPISYVALKMGAGVQAVFFIAIVLTVIAFFLRVAILFRLVSFPIFQFFAKVIFPVLGVILCSSILPVLVEVFVNPGMIRAILLLGVSIMSLTSCIYTFGINRDEKKFLMSLLRKPFDEKAKHLMK